MPNATPSRSTSERSSARKPAAGGDAIALLKQDHKDVKRLFKDYEKLVEQDADTGDKQELAQRICKMLTVHATIEEEIFYPAAREMVDEPDKLDEAEVEHASAKALIAQIESSGPDAELYDAKVHVLSEYINHHVKEEEGEIFPKCKASKAQLTELGSELKERKTELMSEAGIEQ